MIRTKLSYYMVKDHVTAEEINRCTGISINDIDQYIHHKKEMTLTDFVALSKYLGVKPNNFIDESILKYPQNNLHTLRIEKGLTQQELADLVGLTQPKISRFERYRYDFANAYDLGDIAEYFGLSADYILGYIPTRIMICADKNAYHNTCHNEFFKASHTSVYNLIRYAKINNLSFDSVFGFKRKGVN